jgi:hypothetical protein
MKKLSNEMKKKAKEDLKKDFVKDSVEQKKATPKKYGQGGYGR